MRLFSHALLFTTPIGLVMLSSHGAACAWTPLVTTRFNPSRIVDARRGKLPTHVSKGNSLGALRWLRNEVFINVQNAGARAVSLAVKDEFPPQMKLSGLRDANIRIEAQSSMALVYGLTPPRRGRFEFGRIAVRFLSRWNLVWVQTEVGDSEFVKVYPNIDGARSRLKARERVRWFVTSQDSCEVKE